MVIGKWGRQAINPMKSKRRETPTCCNCLLYSNWQVPRAVISRDLLSLRVDHDIHVVVNRHVQFPTIFLELASKLKMVWENGDHLVVVETLSERGAVA